MRRTIFSIVMLACALCTSAAAQPAISLRGNVGAAFFQAPEGLSNVLNSGVNVGMGVGMHVRGGLEVVVEGGYDRFTLNGDTFALLQGSPPSGVRVDGGALNVLNGTLGLRYTLRTRSDVQPYATAGLGLYHTRLESLDVGGGATRYPRLTATRWGYHAAFGARFRINETYRFFFEPRYVSIDTRETELDTSTPTRYVTVRLGIDVSL
jgi:hypothetical protein